MISYRKPRQRYTYHVDMSYWYGDFLNICMTWTWCICFTISLIHLLDVATHLAHPPDDLDEGLLVVDGVRLVHVELCLHWVTAVELVPGLR